MSGPCVETVPNRDGNLTGRIDEITTTAAHASIPDSHKDLIEGSYWAALTTIMPDGQPQTTPVWCNRDGNYVLTNTMRGFRKEKNMRANPQVTVLVVDPNKTNRWIEVRGRVAEVTIDGAVQHADLLAQRYLGKADARFYGDVYKAEWQQYETRVIVKIAPVKLSLDAIFR